METHGEAGTMKGHRLFARIWSLQTRREPNSLKAIRRWVTEGARGRVLEVGVGIGTNWPYLPTGTDYTGIEPDPHMLGRARATAQLQGLELDLRQVDVQSLPFENESFDTVIVTLTFCSVDRPQAGLREIRRVLKPGGELRFAEHVRAINPLLARLQALIKPATRACAGGCEWNRDTVAEISGCGFEDISYERKRVAFLPVVVGSARKPLTG